MDTADLLKRMERERHFWVPLAEGKRLKMLRPLVDEAGDFGNDFSIGRVSRYVIGWDGLVESDFLKTGGSEPVEYDKRLASALLRDHIGWATAVAQAISREMSEQVKRTEDVEKNSETSST